MEKQWGRGSSSSLLCLILHIFIFVRRRDLRFTLLHDLLRQVKAKELLMNKSVIYSPPVQLPIQNAFDLSGFLYSGS